MKEIEPIIIQRKLAAPPDRVWKAITTARILSKWFFQLNEFEPEKGFTFRMIGQRDGAKYPFTGIVTEIETERILSFDWVFDDFHAVTNVRIEIRPDGEGTLLQLTHTGLDALPQHHPHFELKNVVAGWEYFLERLVSELINQSTNRK
jgi:uncharacterized protein YndB with AHSA1/START domain